MAVPTEATYSVAAKIAAHEAFRDLVDGGGAGAGAIKIRDASGAMLAEIPLTHPCGTVSVVTGQLALTPAGGGNAEASGTAAYAEFCSSDLAVYLSLPARAGIAAVSGHIVINTLSIVPGSPVEVLSATVG